MSKLLTQEVSDAICDSLRMCNTIDGSAKKAGVEATTVKDWLVKGRKNDAKEPYLSFARAVELATEEAKEELLRNVMTAKDKHGIHPWQASMELLTKRYWQEYGKSQMIQHEVQEALERTIEAVTKRMSREAVAEFFEALAVVQGLDESDVVEARSAPAATGNGQTQH
jgi:hypothetical protein